MTNKMAEQSALEDLTHCPICFSCFQRPRCLPCLHNFCESCLNQYILSIIEKKESLENGFHCPTCRHFVDISLSANEDNIGRWAAQFPLNHLILTLMDQKSSQEGNLLCNPCKKKSKNERSTSWCRECKIALCCHCAEYHTSLPILEDHKVVSLDATEDSIFCISSQHVLCENHPDKKLEMYCLDHDVACCATCTMIVHRKCERVDTLENVAKGAKTSELKEDLENRFQRQMTLNKDLLLKESTQLEEFDRKCNLMKDTVTNLTQRTTDHLKDLCAKAVSDITQTQEKEQAVRKTNIEIYKGKMKTVENCQKLLSAMMAKSSNVQYFLESKKVKNKLSELEEDMDSPAEECKLEFQINQVFSGLLNHDSLMKIAITGKIDNNSIPSPPLDSACDVVKKDVSHVDSAFPNFRMAGKRNATIIETNSYTSNVTSCLCLKDGRIIIVDNKKAGVQDGHLRVYPPGFQFHSFKLVNFKGTPWDAVLLNSSYMVVTVPSSRRLYLLETGDFSPVDTRTFIIQFFAITKKETVRVTKSDSKEEDRNCLIYLSSQGKVLLMNTLNWNVYQTFELSSQYLSYMAYSNGRLYYGADDKVTCSDVLGKLLWEYSHTDLRGVRGITIGPNEDILVCGNLSDNLFCISKNGDKGQEVLKCPNIVFATLREDFKTLLIVSGGNQTTNLLSQWNVELLKH